MFKKHRPPVGSHPGTLVAKDDTILSVIHIIDYDSESVNEFDLNASQIDKLREYHKRKSVTWVDVQGLGDMNLLKQFGEIFNIHVLALEDVVHVPQRPKADDYEDCLFLVTTMVTMPNIPKIITEQLSVVLGPGFVITFQENPGDVLDPIRNRIRQNKGHIRKNGSDYLAYALLDAVIDAYYPLLEELGDYVEIFEDQVIDDPTDKTLQEIYKIRRELLTLRRSIFPQRELLGTLIRDGNKLIKKSVHIYLRDCYDHCTQVIEITETYRELSSGLMEVYLSGVSNRLNEVMKVLTIISTIFIPLSFFAGIYGMNFQYMPELSYRWSYPIFLGFISFVALGMLVYFKRLGWINFSNKSQPKPKK